jgi:fibrillarin-like rRNA methylase
MSDAGDLDDLVAYVGQSSGLDPSQARRVVDDVLSYLGESPQDFVRRRHAALLRLGWKNEAIYPLIADELAERRFPAPDWSIRQIRRVIYG